MVIVSAGPGYGQDTTAARGPAEDGTLPALTKVAGQGMLASRAFAYLTELSDDIGARVTGSPAMWRC